ncbi:MAG: hypothetical protein F6K28_47850 [Microcoleus sp. SIO2G3]|nr:hypothetical protein [Microcoleus sp. SIO2G3]
MSDISKLDAISAVEDLTDAAAAVVEGGRGSFGYSVRFDTFLPSRSFFVPRGGNIAFAANTGSSPSNKFFTAVLRNLNTGNTTSKIVAVGNRKSVVWKGVRGGSYRIDLVDTRDGIFVSGAAGIAYS